MENDIVSNILYGHHNVSQYYVKIAYREPTLKEKLLLKYFRFKHCLIDYLYFLGQILGASITFGSVLKLMSLI